MTPPPNRPVDEGLIEIDGQRFYAIPDVHAMEPFLMSVVSDGDRWMFVSSTGALTAGRVDANGALFPYETDDRLHTAAGRVGPVTALRVGPDDRVWQPFAPAPEPLAHRSLAKAVHGESIRFEEFHPMLGLDFSYRWDTTGDLGFVRTATLVNTSSAPIQLDLIDGLCGLLPHGLEPTVYQRLSNLSHAYKRSEVVDETHRLAVYTLESPVSDSADPEEIMRATTAWATGLDGATLTLDPAALGRFIGGGGSDKTMVLTGRPGAFLLQHHVELSRGEALEWQIVADVAQSHGDVVERRRRLAAGNGGAEQLRAQAASTSHALQQVMAGADASQCTGDAIACAHHVANVTYNVMRGGIPRAGYLIDLADFARFLDQHNREVRERHREWLAALPETLPRSVLLERIAQRDDLHLLRLGRAYLPFSFSRRHGDPSRPWNAFAIHLHDEDGRPLLHFEGNWRDVFQNWEALCWSFPDYLPGVITLFLNASTADGHNPYRLTSDGIDWEAPDPADPWANIGYWGDHQLIYLLRLLEAVDRFLPGAAAELFEHRCFTYADVPYRIAPFERLVDDPKSTITFDDEAHRRSLARVDALGGDGRLLTDRDGRLVGATMLEKLLVTSLAKLANFVPGGGVWLNTQRPEWNDANNALVGFGLSMVTLHHLRQFLHHLRRVGVSLPVTADCTVAAEVASWLDRSVDALRTTPVPQGREATDHERWAMLELLGGAGSEYRAAIYDGGFSGAIAEMTPDRLTEFCDLAIAHIDATLRTSSRPGGLVHAYNLIDFDAAAGSATITHLPEMLEGQVAALGSGLLTPVEQADLLDALFTSRLYREDQQTFMLAPASRPAPFLEKNVITDDLVASNPLLTALLGAGETTVVRRDGDGRCRFHPDLVDGHALRVALDRLAIDERWERLVTEYRTEVVEAYDTVFDRRAFLGRSTAMYAYEGIGSIYWHMVGKLLLAAQNAAMDAASGGAPPHVVQRLIDAYDRIRAGLGFNKSASEFGAVPTDPYSHTPAHAGAQQPGMTGVVKEELLARPAELGVRVVDGELRFDSPLLRTSELLDQPARWTVVDPSGSTLEVDLEAGTLGFTACQVPLVVETTDDEAWVEVELADGRTIRRAGSGLGADLSAELFGRTGVVRLVRAAVAHPDG